MSVRGDFGKLRGLISRLQGIASGSLTKANSGLMTEAKLAVREALTECFLYQRDPLGIPWAPRKHVYGDFRDTNPILFDLLSYFAVAAEDGRIKVTNSKYYAFFHQTGTRHMVARKFMPRSAAGGVYSQKLKQAALKSLRSSLSGLGLLSDLYEAVISRVESRAEEAQRYFETQQRGGG